MKKLPPRPNLDHLRRQAKSLLVEIADGNPQALQTIAQHLPAAKGMSRDAIRRADWRLADAQSAIARLTGFAAWPQLARHVEQLRALEGTWEFLTLEIEGATLPSGSIASSRLLIDGDRFRTESPEAVYEGIFNIDVEAEPHGIDIEFVAGPEAGNWNYGIFRLDADRLEICLDMNGKPRPTAFRSSAGSGHAHETLRRLSGARPASVTGGSPPEQQTGERHANVEANGDELAFDSTPCATLERLQGEWFPEEVVRDGQALPAMMLSTGRRSAKGNEITISFGGQVMIHALVRIDESQTPMHIDYCNLAGPSQRMIQNGILEWRGDSVCFCMAAPGRPRPDDFSCPAGSGRTLSQWRRKS